MARKLIDLTGQRFGKLTVIGYAGKMGRTLAYSGWLCQCECGEKAAFPRHQLIRGAVTRCPYCQTHAVGTSVWLCDQRIMIIPCEQALRLGSSLGVLLKRLDRENNVNAVMVMLEKVPSESLQALGSELEDGIGESGCAESGEKNWENNAIHFDKLVDNG